MSKVYALPRGGDAGSARGRRVDAMDATPRLDTRLNTDERLCSKVACAREAIATLTFDYGDQMAALGPLGPGGDPHAHDLCAQHAERLSVPAGWLVIRHEAMRS